MSPGPLGKGLGRVVERVEQEAASLRKGIVGDMARGGSYSLPFLTGTRPEFSFILTDESHFALSLPVSSP